jgi:hypothetical protein
MVGMASLRASKPGFAPKVVRPGAALEVAQLDWNWYPITFDNGVPVGGSMHLTLRSDGSYTFSGHFHDSGFPSYDVSLTYLVKDAQNRVYTFTAQGHMAGTLESGSRDYDWAVNGNNPDIASNWASLANGSLGYGEATTSLDIGPFVADFKQAVGVVSDVIAVVGPILALLV